MKLAGWITIGGALGGLAGEFAPSIGSIVFKALGDSAPSWIFFDTSLADLASGPFSPYRNGLAIKYAIGGMVIGAFVYLLMSNQRLEKRLAGSISEEPQGGPEDERVAQARRKFANRKTPVTAPELKEAFGWDWETASAVSTALLGKGSAKALEKLPKAEAMEEAPSRQMAPWPYLATLGLLAVALLWMALGGRGGGPSRSLSTFSGASSRPPTPSESIRDVQRGMSREKVMGILGMPSAVKPIQEGRDRWLFGLGQVNCWYYDIESLREPGRVKGGYLFAEGTAGSRIDFDMKGLVEDVHGGPITGFMGVSSDHIDEVRDYVEPQFRSQIDREL